MISVDNKENCCGCFACFNACPTQSIDMQQDKEGFLYPNIDVKTCIECSICEKVCPILHQKDSLIPLQIKGIRNSDSKKLLEASSGGVFEIFATEIFNKGGTVFGAKFDNKWNVIHTGISDPNELFLLRKSKYVQSLIGNTYKQVKELLKAGEEVLYSGTPCQIAGLRSFLGKEYINLITIDIVCHGVPSQKVWRKYLEENFSPISDIIDINFRNKSTGWPRYSFRCLTKKDGGEKEYISFCNKNPYMRGFLHDLYLRPSCHNCRFKSFKSGADITLSDFWGVWKSYPKWNDQKGASCVAINTTQGMDFFGKINKTSFQEIEVCYDQAYVRYNNSALNSTPRSLNRKLFFLNLDKECFSTLVQRLSKDPLKKQLKDMIHKYFIIIKNIRQ